MPFQSLNILRDDTEDDDGCVQLPSQDTKEKPLKIFRFREDVEEEDGGVCYVIARTLSDARKMLKGINAEPMPDLVVPVKEGRIWL